MRDPLVGDYCHACGQKAHLHSKLSHLLHELMEGVTHFDGRLWRTLPLVAFRPGLLARRWREGKRARYLPPLHFFLLAVFLVFLTPNLTGRHLSLPAGSTIPSTEEAARLEPGGRMVLREGTESERKVAAFIREKLENPEYRSYKAETLAYKLSFLIVPIGVLLLALVLIGRRGFNFYDHAVVALYGAGFIALLTALVLALPSAAVGWAALALMVLTPVHVAVHLRGAYDLGWLSAVMRALMLCLLLAIALVVFGNAILFFSLL